MALDEKVVFCQVDAHLDSNPKIRRAGRDGRDVFEFLLRRVAIGRTAGTVPLKYIEPWYLADILMMTEEDACNGVKRAVTAELISVTEGEDVVRLVGWAQEWGRRPKSTSERVAEYRERKSSKPGDDVTRCNAKKRSVTLSNESNVGEEKRGEEKRVVDVSGKPDPGIAFAEKAISLINRSAGTKYRPDSAAVVKLVGALIKNRHTPEQAELVIQSKRAWVGDPKMGQFFRPATLLAATNFANYLSDLEAGNTTTTTTATTGQAIYKQTAEPECRSPLMLAFDLEAADAAS